MQSHLVDVLTSFNKNHQIGWLARVFMLRPIKTVSLGGAGFDCIFTHLTAVLLPSAGSGHSLGHVCECAPDITVPMSGQTKCQSWAETPLSENTSISIHPVRNMDCKDRGIQFTSQNMQGKQSETFRWYRPVRKV